MRAEDARRFVEAHRAVEDCERRPGAAASPEACWQQALSLFALLGRMVGWPVEPDEIRRREDAAAAEVWARLRAAGARRSGR